MQHATLRNPLQHRKRIYQLQSLYFLRHIRYYLYGESGLGVKMTTHLNLASRLEIIGDMPLLPLYAFTACTGAVLPLSLAICM